MGFDGADIGEVFNSIFFGGAGRVSNSTPATLNLAKLGSNSTPVRMPVANVKAATTLGARSDELFKARMTITAKSRAIDPMSTAPRKVLKVNCFLLVLPLIFSSRWPSIPV